MYINWKSTRIAKDIIIRKYFLKKELRIIFIKSFLQNQNIDPLIRAYLRVKLTCSTKQKKLISTQTNRCLLTGKGKTTFKISSFSRQSSKKLIDLGLMQNIKAETY